MQVFESFDGSGLMGNLLILGAGQYGMIAKEIAEAVGKFDRIDFLDDTNDTALDNIRNMDIYKDRYRNAVVAIGNAAARAEYLLKLKKCGYDLATLIHPEAYVSPSAKIGGGCIIEPKAVVSTAACVGEGCFVSSGAVVNHNSVLEDVCHINCGAIVASGSVVPKGTRVDYGIVFRGKK